MSGNTVEGELLTGDGKKLYTKTWKTAGAPKAIIAFIHGFSDHCNAYQDFFPRLSARGFEVRSFDQRGWGRSVTKPAERGWTGPTSVVMSDITTFLKTIIPTQAPLFLFGHSMGGQEVLYWLHDGPTDLKKHIRGYLLESPFVVLDAKSKPNPFTVIIGRIAGKLLPHRQMEVKLDAKLLSRDPQVQKELAEDKLCHDMGTLEGLAGNLDRAAALDTGKVSIPIDAGEGGNTRIWISHGTKDHVCDYRGSEKVYGRLKGIEDKELKLYDGWLHKLHVEPSPDKETYENDVVHWIEARLSLPVRSKL